MKNALTFVLLGILASCTTIHFRSKNSIPVTFEGNANHKEEVNIVGEEKFYFWGLKPEHHVVYLDDEVRKAGHDGLSKLIVYEHKSPQDILISFLTFGVFMPRGYTITGYSSGNKIPNDFDEETKNQN
ncbi:MAG TPA: hypothetical protein VNJ01_09715 [Bacteriovoracaceae bacterium]|nr:hypothetical protein [Bacteriovoracaceae bacterium]